MTAKGTTLSRCEHTKVRKTKEVTKPFKYVYTEVNTEVNFSEIHQSGSGCELGLGIPGSQCTSASPL